MPKRAADEPGTSTTDPFHEQSPFDAVLAGTETTDTICEEPPAKRIDLDIKQEFNGGVQSGGLIKNESELTQMTIKQETEGNINEARREEEDEEQDEDSRTSMPPALGEDDDYEEDDADSFIDKTNTPPPSQSFLEGCRAANLPNDIVTGAWETYNHAVQRVSLEGSESAWQLSAIYYYLLSKGIKRRGKTIRILIQPFPVSILTIANSFDISVAEMLDKTARFVEIIHSRKIRRYQEYIRRIQEGLAVSCVIFKKFCRIFCKIFEEIKVGSENCPSSHELFTVLWTSFLVMKSRMTVDDLISNYQLLFSILDQVYTEMCSMKEGIVHHLNQKFVEDLLENDCTIIRALCTQFGGSVLDARHFSDHTFKKMEKTGIPSTWNFQEFRDLIMNVPKTAYENYLLQRGSIDERIFIPSVEDFSKIFQSPDTYSVADILKVSYSGRRFRDAEFLTKISNNHCLEKLALGGKVASEKLVTQSKEQPRVPCVEYNLELGNYPDDLESNNQSLYNRLTKIIGSWKLENSKLEEVCGTMSDSPMATILLKSDEMTNKFERTLSAELGETINENIPKYHYNVRKELELVFLIFMEKIIVAELKKKVREEDLLNVIRREEFLDSVFCFCVELILVSNGYDRPFPWSAELCGVHPFMFHKVIDLMITHEKQLSRQMVQHFSRIEETVIEYFSWKSDSPLWPMVVRCPFAHFQEFGEDWADKLNSYSPIKFTPIKKPDDLRDELGRPIVPQNQTSRTLRIFLKRTYFTAARRLQDLTDRVSMGARAKSQCWSLFDYLLRNDTLIFMDRHLDQILLCCVFVIMKINESSMLFTEIMAQYRRQSANSLLVYRSVTVFQEQLNPENPQAVNTKETILERLEGPQKEKTTVDIIKYYNIEFRDRIKYIIGQIDSASDEDLMEMPVATESGLMPVRVYLTHKLSIQTLPKTKHGESKQERAIANLEKSGITIAMERSGD